MWHEDFVVPCVSFVLIRSERSSTCRSSFQVISLGCQVYGRLGDLKKKSKKVASGDKVVEIIAEKVDDNEIKTHQEVAKEARKEDKVVDGKIS